MDKVNLSLETLSAVSGKSVSELSSALFDENEKGEKSLKTSFDVDKFVLENYRNKVENLVSSKSEENRGRARREAFEEIEKEAKTLGIDMTWKDDRLNKLKDHFLKANKEMKPDDVKNSELFRTTVAGLHDKIKELESTYEQKINKQRSQHLNDLLAVEVGKIVRNDQSKLALPKDDSVTKNLIRLLVNDIQDENTRIDYKDGKWIVLDGEGREKVDESKGFTPVSFVSHVIGKAKSGYFPEMSSKNISSNTPFKTVNESTVVQKVDDKEVVWDIPKNFKDKKEYYQFINEMEIKSAPGEVFKKAKAVFDNA